MRHDERLARFAEAVKAQNARARVELTEIQSAFREVMPSEANSPDARTRLAEFVNRLPEADPAIALPGARGWQRMGPVQLPRFVRVERPRRDRACDPAGYFWLPEMGFATAETDPDRRAELRAVNDWLRQKAPRAIDVPIKERSLEIFGDEKRLDQKRQGTRLFGDRLGLADLKCFVAPRPMPFEAPPGGAPGKPVLLVENNDTYASFHRWNADVGAFSAVAYAGGGHEGALQYDEAFLDDLRRRVEGGRLLYFGDLDARGLNLPAKVDERRRKDGLEPLEPALGLYRWLLDHGTAAGNRSSVRLLDVSLAWIGADLAPRIQELLDRHERIAQEHFGLAQLHASGLPAEPAQGAWAPKP